MLMNEWAVVLNALSIGLIGLLAATGLLASLLSCVEWYIKQCSAAAQKMMLWLFVATPWLVSIICVVVFVPSLFGSRGIVGLDRLAHWHHPNVFYLDSWHGATLLLFILGLMYVLGRTVVKAVRHVNALDTLTRLSCGQASRRSIARDIIVLESQAPSVFTAGFLRPKCYVTTGLIDQVSEAQLAIIIDHERAHIRHRDTQQKLLFALVVSLYPKPAARLLNRLFSLATEQLADAQVGKSYCTLDIAQTLVRAARIQRCFASNLHPAMVSYFVADDVDFRVRALVGPQRIRSFPKGYCLLVMVTITLFSAMGVDMVHHLVEAVFSH